MSQKNKCTMHIVDVHPHTGKLYCSECKTELSQEEATAILKSLFKEWNTVHFTLETMRLTSMLIKADKESERKEIRKAMRRVQNDFLKS